MRRAAWLLPAVVALAARVLTGPHPIDDAYITFRYARNLADGLGLVYNPGEWVLGTTTPLWALVLSAAYRLGLTDLPWDATVISAVCDAVTVMLILRLCRSLGWWPRGASLVGLAWAINPMSVAFATGGMETSLFVLMALAALSLAASRRHFAVATFLAGLATLVRPEGGLLAATLVGWTWLVERKLSWTSLAAPIAAAGPIGAAGLVFFLRYGSPLPHSIAAKSVAYEPAGPFDNLLVLILQAGLPGWSTYILAALPTAASVILVLFGLSSFVLLGRHAVVWMQSKRVAWQPFAVFALLYIGFYAIVGLRGVRLFNWYLLPIEPFYLLAAAAGLARLGSMRSSLIAGVLLLWQLPAIDWQRPPLPTGETLLREQMLFNVGASLAQSLSPDAVIAAPEIGALGFSSNLRILDTVGLVSPSALRYYPLPPEQLITDNAVPAALIHDQQPDAIVALDAYTGLSLAPDPAFQREYRLEAAYPAIIWQSHELLVFRRIAKAQ